ncbi:MAG: Oxidoreductase domain protein [Verrucomicrobiales bacterium]|nr:Oxidoreductase domain protein [Verrucomicrobiales bacterium]
MGFMAMTHLKAYAQLKNARIVALFNPSGKNLDGDFSRVAGNVGTNEPFRLSMEGIRTYTQFSEFLADGEIDVVDICAPTPSHPELAIAALRSGKHVLCEKPLARTSKIASSIVTAAGKASGFFMPAMCIRFWPEYAWLKEQIQSGQHGRVLAARFRRVTEPPGWGQHNFLNGSRSGGALLDLHIHDTDFIHYCFGKPERVYSSGYSKLSGAIDHVVTQYEYPSTIVSAEGTWAMTPGFGFNMSYTVVFENATVDFDIARGAEALKLFVAGKPAEIIELKQADGYVQELAYFLSCIEKNERPLRVTAQDALDAIVICEAEEESIRIREPAKISD